VLDGDSPHRPGGGQPQTDVSSSLEAEMQSLVDALNCVSFSKKVVKQIAVQIVELYPYVNNEVLLSGSWLLPICCRHDRRSML